MFKNPLRKRQYIGSLVGIVIGIIIYIVLPQKSTEEYLSIGPANTGHEGLSCNTCHTPAKGTLVQQLQSNISYAFGQRKTSADFGTENVDNKKCLACHDRPNDRHPQYRFSEPKFKDAIAVIDATQCETCHQEHNGVRVALPDANYCMNCHQDLKVHKDPLDVSHEELIKKGQWTTCLQCHDFHGNHVYVTPEKMKDTIPISKIKEYLKGGKDPFSEEKKYVPLSEEEWLMLKEKYEK